MRRSIFATFLVFLLSSCGMVERFDIQMIERGEKQPEKNQDLQVKGPEKKLKGPPEIVQKEQVEVEELPEVKRLPVRNTAKVNKYCEKLNKRFLYWGWGKGRCKSYQWHHVRNSFLGDPLIWKVFGDETNHRKGHKNTTMILCGVHGDEITPVKFCFDVIAYLQKQDPRQFKDKLVVVAPLVTPDSFFRGRPTRTNYRGVDVNRNFPTRDWQAKAIKLWKSRYRKDKRRFPGEQPLSEQETIFQVNLIKRYSPDKIISVHAPLTILDYDGPVVQKKHPEVAEHANQLLVKMSEQAKGYKIKNYPFFPGSLGNYAGNERGVPTYTLELPSSDNRKHKVYWNLFKESIHSAIFHDFRNKPKVATSEEKPEPTVEGQENL